MGTPTISRLVPEQTKKPKETNAKKSEPRKPDSDKGYVLVGGVQYWKPDVKKPQTNSSQSHQSMAKAKPKSPRAKAKAKATPKTKGKAKPKAVSKAKAKPKTKAKAKAKPKPVSKAKAKPTTKAKSEDAVLKIWKHCQGAKVQK